MPDLAHVAPHGIGESGAGVLEQMPAIGDLQHMRELTARGFAVSTAAIARDDLDLPVVAEPGRYRRHLAIGQQIDDAAAFKIANNCAISLIATPSEVVDANDAGARHRQRDLLSDDPQQCVGAERKGQTICEPFARSTSERQPELIGNQVKAAGSPRMGSIDSVR